MKNICIFGASGSRIDQDYIDAAYRLGTLLGEHGLGLVFGGGDTGLMGAAARGAYSRGGRIIGVIPEKLNRPGIAFPNCTELIVTPDMHSRKAEMERLSSAFVAVPGGFGTFEELLEVITLNQLGYISAPVIMLNTNGYYDRLIAHFDHCVAEGFALPGARDIYALAETPEQALELALNMAPAALPDKLAYALEGKKEESHGG